MKPSDRRNWLVFLGTAITLGCCTSFSEFLISKAIDSLLPSAKGVTSYRRPGTITILSSNGEVIQKLGPATREKVEIDKMTELIKKSFVAAEDRRFFKHKGIDSWGIIRALLRNIKKGSVQEGGSTITQQLARTVFLSQDKTLTRKLKEAALAYKLERELSKEEILQEYLNNVYLGSGAYGIADASWVYFSKEPNELNLAEVAIIAGLPPAPSLYSPLVNPNLAIKRRNIVLNRMFEAGYISNIEFKRALENSLALKPAIPKFYNSSAPFFTSWIAKEIPKILSPEQLEIGGLKIKTTLNLNWQKEAQKVLRKFSPGNTEGSILSIEPNTGKVRVMVGGKDFTSTQFNRATQALRSPGSTFKLIPFVSALEYGLKPEDKFIDTPICWYGYCPKNFGNKYVGEVSLADALKDSHNTVAVQILAKVGFERVISTANRLGIGNQRKLGKYYPLAIGAYEQTLLEMTSAYSAITNRGVYIKPTPFEEIRGANNAILWSNKSNGDKGKKVINRDIADTMNWMLQRVVKNGTGLAATLPNRPVAGKTGTSEGGRDLWFIGSIPQLTTGVWFGYDNNKETKSGSGEAAWVWKKFMSEVSPSLKIINFPSRPISNKEVELKEGKLILPVKGPRPKL